LRSNRGLLGLTSRIDRGRLPQPLPFASPPLNASLRLALNRGQAVRRFFARRRPRREPTDHSGLTQASSGRTRACCFDV
jgi:hypothetical protein